MIKKKKKRKVVIRRNRSWWWERRWRIKTGDDGNIDVDDNVDDVDGDVEDGAAATIAAIVDVDDAANQCISELLSKC